MIHYQNPRVVVGCIPAMAGQDLCFAGGRSNPVTGIGPYRPATLKMEKLSQRAPDGKHLEEAGAAVARTESLRALQHLLRQPDLPDVQGPSRRSGCHRRQ